MTLLTAAPHVDTEVDIGVDLSRRSFTQSLCLAGAGSLVIGGAVVTSGCGKNISIYTATVIGTLKELRPLLPNLADRLNQAIAIAETFDKAYREGKFLSAALTFENLTLVVNEIVKAIGIMSDQVRIAIAVGGVALHGIAAILKAQSTEPAVAAAVAAAQDSKSMSAKLMIERMGDMATINQILKLVTP